MKCCWPTAGLLQAAVMSNLVSAAPIAYVTNQLHHNISVVVLDNYQVIATIPVGLNPAGVTVCDNDKRLLYAFPKKSKLVDLL